MKAREEVIFKVDLGQIKMCLLEGVVRARFSGRSSMNKGIRIWECGFSQ